MDSNFIKWCSDRLVSLFLLYASGVFRWQFVHHLENLAYDLRINFTLKKGTDDRIVIIDIDEKSLAEHGRWPWPRDRIAHLIDLLFDYYGIGILGMDVVWAEPDESSGLGILESLAGHQLSENMEYLTVLEQIRPNLQRDRIFAESLRNPNHPTVLGFYFDTEIDKAAGNISGQLPKPIFNKNYFRGKAVSFIEAGGYGANLPDIQDAATDAGHFNPDPDIDGIVRRVPMLIEYDGEQYASLSLAISRLIFDNAKIEPRFAEGFGVVKSYHGLEWLGIADRVIPVDEHARALVPYRGPKGSFNYIPVTEIFNKTADKNKLKGTIALLGTSAPGLLDLRAAPMQANYPGVEIHANMIAGIIDRNIKENPAWKVGAEFVTLLLIGLTMGLLLPLLSPLLATGLTVLLTLLTIFFNLYMWQQANLVLPISASILLIFGLYILNMSYGYFIESRGKRQLAGLFGQYIPSELVDEMSDNPASFSLEGSSREMTVFFSDIRDFTTVSESLEPGELQRLIKEFLTPITRIIHSHRGTIDKYMGDAVMAFWGAPIRDPDHARNALIAGLEIIKSLDDLSTSFEAKGWPRLRLGIGINSGIMSVGDMGSEFRRSYTVMGDAVNLGSRLEGLTKQYGVQIIVSEFTKNSVQDFAYRELDKVRVKGKDKPVTIFEPIGAKIDLDKDEKSELDLYTQTLKYYREQNWDLAEMQFINLQKQTPSRILYQTYLARIAYFRKNPPGEKWDGVFTFKTK
ncbi:MAG: adenylate/guanylate cyclase domain-containing protein [Gammaproteobacteria bacterium]|nr:MAG: adenylate/guanylate cyclase domain-containing protein [Gammaproteobacteria bacterium]